MYQYDLISVPTGLPVLAYWDEPRRSTYHFTSGVRIRLVRSRCSRHEPQPAAQARPIERACSKTVGGQRLGHFSRTAFVTSTGRFCVVFLHLALCFPPSHPIKDTRSGVYMFCLHVTHVRCSYVLRSCSPYGWIDRRRPILDDRDRSPRPSQYVKLPTTLLDPPTRSFYIDDDRTVYLLVELILRPS